MITDIERLHKVVTSKHYLGRQSGYTFAQCHNVASALHLGNSDIVCFITFQRDIMYLLPMLQEVLFEYDIEILNVQNNKSIIHTSLGQIQFIPTGKSNHDNHNIEELIRLNYKLRSYDNYVVISMGHYD